MTPDCFSDRCFFQNNFDVQGRAQSRDGVSVASKSSPET